MAGTIFARRGWLDAKHVFFVPKRRQIDRCQCCRVENTASEIAHTNDDLGSVIRSDTVMRVVDE